MPCLAQSAADNVWYRAKIVSLNEPDQVKIHFIDYGNSEIMSMNNVSDFDVLGLLFCSRYFILMR